MATNKPTKPSVSLPDSFGGIKTPYTESQIENGYEDGIPQIVDGGNINYEKDALFQKVKYCEAIADVINGILPNNTIAVDSNNRFEYTTQVQMATDIDFADGTSELKVPNVKQTRTALDGKANDSDVVHKSGNENITGAKTFLVAEMEIPLYFRNNNLDRSVSPETTTRSSLRFTDKNNNQLTTLQCSMDTSGSVFSSLYAIGKGNNLANITVGVKADGTVWTSAPASGTQSNGIVTTITAATRGVKLGNGYIINWGYGATNGTCTFAVPFSNTSYIVALASDSSGGFPYYSSKTTTNFKMTNHTGAYIAIGR